MTIAGSTPLYHVEHRDSRHNWSGSTSSPGLSMVSVSIAVSNLCLMAEYRTSIDFVNSEVSCNCSLIIILSNLEAWMQCGGLRRKDLKDSVVFWNTYLCVTPGSPLYHTESPWSRSLDLLHMSATKAYCLYCPTGNLFLYQAFKTQNLINTFTLFPHVLFMSTLDSPKKLRKWCLISGRVLTMF
jgi:hypothetical protein